MKLKILILLVSIGIIVYGAVNESKIIILGLIGFFGVIFAPMVLKEIRLGIRDADILKIGIAGKAELLKISPRSGGNDSYPGVTIKAKVFYEDDTTNIVTIEDCISTVRLPMYIPGYIFDVKYDPNDKNKVALIQEV